jgi:hypothetical protein
MNIARMCLSITMESTGGGCGGGGKARSAMSKPGCSVVRKAHNALDIKASLGFGRLNPSDMIREPPSKSAIITSFCKTMNNVIQKN